MISYSLFFYNLFILCYIFYKWSWSVQIHVQISTCLGIHSSFIYSTRLDHINVLILYWSLNLAFNPHSFSIYSSLTQLHSAKLLWRTQFPLPSAEACSSTQLFLPLATFINCNRPHGIQYLSTTICAFYHSTTVYKFIYLFWSFTIYICLGIIHSFFSCQIQLICTDS